jgi:hypothetical protein
LTKSVKGDSLPDIAKITGAEGGKKAKVDGGIVKSGGKGDEFAEFSFKEGHTAVLKLSDIALQEKGKDALKKAEHHEPAAAAKVKGAKGKKKAASKQAAKEKKTGKKSAEPSAAASKSVEKVMKFTPSKGTTPQKAGTASAGKVLGKRSTTGAKRTPAMPSPGGKKSTKTTDQMTMEQFQKYLAWHEKKKGGKTSSGGKVLGKRSAGKASASGKSSKAGKRSKK